MRQARLTRFAGMAGVCVICYIVLLGALSPQGALDEAAPIRFRDVAREAGIGFVLENCPTDRKHLIETMPGGIAAFDYDGDGLTDIYFTNGASVPSLEKNSPKYSNRLYRNLGGFKFKDVTREAGVAGVGYSMGAAAGDYDNDGHIDLFVAGVGRNILYRNRGDGSFEDVTTKAGIKSDAWSVGGAWLDYDNDGLLDLFVVNYVQWSPAFDVFCGNPAGNIRVYCHPRFFKGLPNRLYHNQGDGTFKDVSAESGIAAHVGKGMAVAIADYDRDGFPDILVTNDKMPNFLFHNLRNGHFEEVAFQAGVALLDSGSEISNMGADFRDFNNDGLPDIAATALSGETFPLFRNQGHGHFTDAGYSSRMGKLSRIYSGWSIGMFDFNNDGWKDIFTTNSHVNDRVEAFEATEYKQHNSIFLNDRNGTFSDVSAGSGEGFSAKGAHRGAAFADFNNDGRIDVVVSALGQPAELWENVSPAENTWLTLRLTGTKSNRNGIGAEINIGDQYNHMTTAVGYASSSHGGVHFGFGKQKQIDLIKIRWPSGIRQELRNVPTNQVLDVREAAQ
ncbi:MAG TPA: CRTAC1 family protein [Bryobacteraceae bacterium]|nr:CRTAC1 family protein [Bryobacteraceae bacterium]